MKPEHDSCRGSRRSVGFCALQITYYCDLEAYRPGILLWGLGVFEGDDGWVGTRPSQLCTEWLAVWVGQIIVHV